MNRLVFGLGVLFAACEAQVPVEEYCAERARAACEAQQRCGAFSARTACSDVPAISDCLARERLALSAGAVRYDERAAARCIAAIRDASCETGVGVLLSTPTPEACLEVFVGSATEGQSCGACESGLSCERTMPGCGTCQVRRSPDPGLQERAPCSVPSTPGEPQCGLGLWCRSTSEGTSACARRMVPGERCDQGPFCTVNARCQDGLCVESADVGESCGVGCKQGLFCSTEDRCVPQRALGAACERSEECRSFTCFDNLCVPRRAAGMSCSLDVACDAELACVEGLCVPLPANGEACDLRLACAGGAACVDGTCWDSRLECR